MRAGLSDGRLVPPPSVIFATRCRNSRAIRANFWRHTCATVARVAAGFGLGVAAGTLLGRRHRLFDACAPSARSDPAGAARDPVDRLGAAVHPLARHLRGVEGDADRGRRVLSGLSRRHGRDPLASTARSSRSAASFRLSGPALVRRILLPAVLPAYVVVAALRARPRLDVRRRGRIHGRVRGPRLPADRRPAARQAGADRRRHHRLRGARQGDRLAARARRRAVPALAGPSGAGDHVPATPSPPCGGPAKRSGGGWPRFAFRYPLPTLPRKRERGASKGR